MTVVDLSQDERKLIEVLRAIKFGVGFGYFEGTIAAREIKNLKAGQTYKLD